MLPKETSKGDGEAGLGGEKPRKGAVSYIQSPGLSCTLQGTFEI